jgi:hypothetical protein
MYVGAPQPLSVCSCPCGPNAASTRLNGTRPKVWGTIAPAWKRVSKLARSGLTFQRAEAAPVDRVSRGHRSRHRGVLPHLSGVRVEQVSPEGGVLRIVAATPEWAPMPVGT